MANSTQYLSHNNFINFTN